MSASIWITGPTRSGKTTRLVNQFCTWLQTGLRQPGPSSSRFGQEAERTRKVIQPSQRSLVQQTATAILVFAATGDNRLELVDRITVATQGQCPVQSTTPLGFFQDEVMLFWPLLIQRLNLKAQFPIGLRPENEQELATQLWRSQLDREMMRQSGIGEYRLVRQILDLIQLAALSGTPIEEISAILEQGLPEQELSPSAISELLLYWRQWCLERGLLTYGLITELYWRHLLPEPTYQRQLLQRYRAVIADDLDNYPAIARHLFDFLLDQGVVGAFSFNPDGAVRLGLGADPQYLEGLKLRCQVETLSEAATPCLGKVLGSLPVELVNDPLLLSQLPESVQSIQTTSRSQLLRQTAEVIVAGVQAGEVQPQDVVVIAPGLDAIARYTLTEILTNRGIAVETLSDQRPLASSPMIRALLTLLTFVYPGLGRLVDRDAVAEMLVVLSQKPGAGGQQPEVISPEEPTQTSVRAPWSSAIDLVRACLLADHCFEPHPDQPRLLPVTAFPRWDRLGYQATAVYEEILQWLEVQKLQQEQRLIPSAISVLDRAIQRFLWNGSYLPYDQLAALRELIETAQHYWEVDARLRQKSQADTSASTTVGNFIQLLRSGTITANPYPVRSLGLPSQAVTLATVFQYRSSRRSHRWQFWMDAGSSRWLSGTDALFAAPLFLQNRTELPWTEADTLEGYEQRLRRILLDLLGRAEERVYLCHSDLAVNGQDQIGPLLALINASVPYSADSVSTLT